MVDITQQIEDFNEHNDRVEGFSEVASNSSINGLNFLHIIALGLAPLACAIDGAMLCFHLIPKMYRHIQKDPDCRKTRLISYRTLLSIPVTILGIAALAISGTTAALPLGIISGGIKTVRAGFELANNPHPTNQAHKKTLRERMFFNLFGAATLVALIAAPPIGAVMGLVGLSMSTTAIAINAKSAVQQTGFSGVFKQITQTISNIFSRNRAPIPAPHPEPAPAPVVINTPAQRRNTQTKPAHAPPHAAGASMEQHPELQGEFKPKYKPHLETIAEETQAEEADEGEEAPS